LKGHPHGGNRPPRGRNILRGATITEPGRKPGGDVDVREQGNSTVTVVCRSSIMKGAIASSLERDGLECVDETARRHTDVAVVVTSQLTDSSNEPDRNILDGITSDRWVVISGHADDPVLQYVLEQGHRPCVVPEDIDGDDLGHVVKLAASGHIISMDRFCQGRRPGDARMLAEANLDPDQWCLLELLSEGLSNKEIAIAQDISESAVKSRLRCLLHRLGLSNRTKAAVLAVRCGIGQDQA
jgi:hypothetical protein